MTKKTKEAPKERVFNFNGIKLKDPDKDMSTDQVRDFYSGTHPELNNADMKGPKTENGKQVYTFSIRTGTKG